MRVTVNIDIVIIRVEQNEWTGIDETKTTVEHVCDVADTETRLFDRCRAQDAEKQPRSLEDATFSGFHLWI